MTDPCFEEEIECHADLSGAGMQDEEITEDEESVDNEEVEPPSAREALRAVEVLKSFALTTSALSADVYKHLANCEREIENQILSQIQQCKRQSTLDSFIRQG